MKKVTIKPIKDPKYRAKFNEVVDHPLQSWEWGEFRKKTGVMVERWGIWEGRKLKQGLQITIHKLPKVNYTIGYLPKSFFPSRWQKEILQRVAKKHKCIFIKIEPKVEKGEINKKQWSYLKKWGFKEGKSLFTKYNFVLDINKREEELLARMKSKTRYNIRLGQRKGVKVEINNSQEAWEKFFSLMQETTKRQGFYAHGREYYQKMWQTLQNETGKKNGKKVLKADLLVAKYKGEIITAWVVFQFGQTMYYPYGASTRKYKEVMASNVMMWEVIKLAKKRGCQYFDMWGALGPQADKKNPWYGFHRFKAGYGPRLVEYVGSYDMVVRPWLYTVFRWGDRGRWQWLRLKSRLQR